MACPSVSLISLNRSRSINMTAICGSDGRCRASTSARRCWNSTRFGETGQVVVQRLVAQAVDQPGVLQRDAGVRGDRLEQPPVLLVERAHVAEPVGDRQDADHLVVGDERRHDAVALPALREMGADPRDRATVFEPTTGRPLSTSAASDGCSDGSSGPGRDVGVAVEHQPVDALVVAGRQDRQLGDLGPHHLAGLREDVGDDLLGVTRSAHGLRELVQQLQAGVALAQRRVLPVRHAEDRPDRERAAPRPGRRPTAPSPRPGPRRR